MNVFRFLADHLHLLSMIFLLGHILHRRSCKSISGKTQLLLATVFVARYSDIFTNFISEYNTIYKVIFVALTFITAFSIYVVFRSTYQRDADTFPTFLLIVGILICTFIRMNYSFSSNSWTYDNVLEWFWTFSIYLEAVAVIPQIYMLYKLGYQAISREIVIYLTLLGLYRFFYLFNWWYRWETERYYDKVSIYSAIIQSLIFASAGLAYLHCVLSAFYQQEVYSELNGVEERKPWSTLLDPKTIQSMPPMLVSQSSEKILGAKY